MRASDHLRFCQVRSDLLDTLNAATNFHASAVRELSDCIMAQKESVDARLRVTDAMNATIAARDVLTEHRLFHGC